VPDDGTLQLYEELRRAASASAPTAAVATARTLIAHAAVTKGAPEGRGRTFQFYVDWLEAGGFITAPMKPWIDHIRDQGNVAVHELAIATPEDAERVVRFAEMLLRIMFEFPGNVPAPPTATP